MKWIFLLFLTGLVPFLVQWMRGNARVAPFVWMAVGFLPFITTPWHLYVAPVSWPMWPGYAKGIEISLLDALALAMLLSVPARARTLPFKFPLFFFLLMLALSALQAEVALAAMFPVWQFMRMILVIAAVASACHDDRAALAIIDGMVGGLCYQTAVAMGAHLGGALQTGGSLGHQNLLGLMSHFVVFPALAVLLSGRRSIAGIAGPLAGATAVVLTASRATIGLAAPGYLVTVALSLMVKPTKHKMMIGGIGVAALILAAPFAAYTLTQRFEQAPLSADYDERAAFERAATMIIAEHPLGIGANNYVLVVNTRGYAERAGVEPTFGSRSANVHNIYLLMAAELGVMGALAFGLVLLWPAAYGLVIYFARRRTGHDEILLGLGIAIVLVSVHSLFEWILIMFPAQYLLAIVAGLIAGLGKSRGLTFPESRQPSPTDEVGHSF
jgi:O-antigen ligase